MPELQSLLVCLAPFTSVIDERLLTNYSAQLKEQAVLASLPFEQWNEVVEEAEHWGLLRRDAEMAGYLRMQPTLPYVLRAQLQQPDQAVRREAIETAFNTWYYQFGIELANLLHAQDPQNRKFGQNMVSLEYENLVQAVTISARQRVLNIGAYTALSRYLEQVQEPQRGLDLVQDVLRQVENYLQDHRQGSAKLYLAFLWNERGKWQLWLNMIEDAEKNFQRVLEYWNLLPEDEESTIKQQRASLYTNLGIVAREKPRWEEADDYYKKALCIYKEYGERFEQARTYHNLGMIAQEQRKWEGAEKYYQAALRIYEEYRERFEQARTYHNLGIIAQKQRRWEEADDYYKKALCIYEEHGEQIEQAGTYHQLGIVNQKQRKWEKAEKYYREALRIYEEHGEQLEQASTYHQLGIVAQKQRRWEEAEKYYQEALRIYEEYGKRFEQASTYHQLGMIAQEQRKWEEAEKNYREALRLEEECRARFEQASTYHQLGMLAQEQRKWEEAEKNYREALRLEEECGACFEQASTYHQLGMIAQEQRKWEEARTAYLTSLDIIRAFEGTEFETSLVIGSLARLWQVSGDETLPTALATRFQRSREEAEQVLHQVLEP